MHVTLDAVRIGDEPIGALPETSLTFESGAVRVVAVETEQRPTVLSLVASGRMRVDAGTITPPDLQLRVALVDTPLVAEPPAEVKTVNVVREEFALAGHRGSAAAFLAERGLTDFARAPFGALPPLARISLLVDLALLRPGIEGLVITSPERHGGDPAEWWALATSIARRGIAVLIVTDRATAQIIERLQS